MPRRRREMRRGMRRFGALAFLIALILATRSMLSDEPKHWAYVAPVQPKLPQTVNRDWPRSALDLFTLARMETEGLAPSPEADRETLIRRVTYDVTGLPPTLEEIDAFLQDRSPDAYERLVDRLLASPRYGQRMATPWLDAARYADTHGYHADSHRDMWAWRDWVVAAFNRNMPFDQFTIEQIAGDLLPHATESQRLASGFHRNTLINFEQGAIPEEYLNEYVADRVITTSAVWLGQTLQCARCHDHKYDPFTQRDFYRLYAYFNNVPENGLDGRAGNAIPTIDVPTTDQVMQLARLREQMNDLTSRMMERRQLAAQQQSMWERELASRTDAVKPPTDTAVYASLDQREGSDLKSESGELAGKLQGAPQWFNGKFDGGLMFDGATHIEFTAAPGYDRDDAFSFAMWVMPTTLDPMTLAACMSDDRNAQGWEFGLERGHLVARMTHDADKNSLEVRATKPLALRKWQHVAMIYDGSSRAGGVTLYLNGQPLEKSVVADQLSDSIITTQHLRVGRRADRALRGLADDVRLYARRLDAAECAALAGSNPVVAVLAIPSEKRTTQQNDLLIDYYVNHVDQQYSDWQRQLLGLQREERDVRRKVPTVMVMQTAEQPRHTYVLERGDYREPGEEVTPGTPPVLPPLPADAPADRLGLAQWLTNEQNPLVARVTVNRFWQMYFGTGLVSTPDDFGARGESPSHPELLDWLAIEFVKSGWDVKRLQCLILTSATYRQSSQATDASYARDPDNRLLARGPRVRLSAEMIRDSALYASGLMIERGGGSGVYPYQPAGLWEEISYNPDDYTAQVYVQSHGADLYRRSLYMFWKRTSPPPGLLAFDAPNRETCVLRRARSNTPLQAFVLMNDPTYVESARVLAQRVLTASLPDDTARLKFAFRFVLARSPQEVELRELSEGLSALRTEFRQNRASAESLLSIGESERSPSLDVTEWAAWTSTCSILFNLDESITNH